MAVPADSAARAGLREGEAGRARCGDSWRPGETSPLRSLLDPPEVPRGASRLVRGLLPRTYSAPLPLGRDPRGEVTAFRLTPFYK